MTHNHLHKSILLVNSPNSKDLHLSSTLAIPTASQLIPVIARTLIHRWITTIWAAFHRRCEELGDVEIPRVISHGTPRLPLPINRARNDHYGMYFAVTTLTTIYQQAWQSPGQ